MKKYITVLFVLLLTAGASAQTGKYAGSQKTLIGKTYTDVANIPGLSGWEFREGSLLTGLDDTEVITASILKKGTTYILLFSIKADPASKEIMIADLVELKDIPSSQHVRTGSCREGANEAVNIVALVKEENTEFSSAIKAWRFNMDKRRIETMSPALVKCMNEVGH